MPSNRWRAAVPAAPPAPPCSGLVHSASGLSVKITAHTMLEMKVFWFEADESQDLGFPLWSHPPSGQGSRAPEGRGICQVTWVQGWLSPLACAEHTSSPRMPSGQLPNVFALQVWWNAVFYTTGCFWSSPHARVYFFSNIKRLFALLPPSPAPADARSPYLPPLTLGGLHLQEGKPDFGEQLSWNSIFNWTNRCSEGITERYAEWSAQLQLETWRRPHWGSQPHRGHGWGKVGRGRGRECG